MSEPKFSKNKLILAILGILVILILTIPQLIVRQNHRYNYATTAELVSKVEDLPDTALVFGGGINNGQPRPVLEKRLLAAKTLYDEGLVSKILLSGDSEPPYYDEPEAMKNYLINQQIPESALFKDPYGFSTYESCERSIKVYRVERLIAVTQTGHLDRAVYLCRSFGIETYGFAAERAGSSTRTGQLVREVGSNIKAVFNVYLIGEQTEISEPIPLKES